ncbi:MAG: hypothetical protein AB7L91_12850 [Dehalococcoidia bacterium]
MLGRRTRETLLVSLSLVAILAGCSTPDGQNGETARSEDRPGTAPPAAAPPPSPTPSVTTPPVAPSPAPGASRPAAAPSAAATQQRDDPETPPALPPRADTADGPLAAQTPAEVAGPTEGQPDAPADGDTPAVAATATDAPGDSAAAAPPPPPANEQSGGNEGVTTVPAEEDAAPPVVLATEEATPPEPAQETVALPPPAPAAASAVAAGAGIGPTPVVVLAQPSATPSPPTLAATPLAARPATTPSAARETPTPRPVVSPTPASSPRATVPAATPLPTTTPRSVSTPAPTPPATTTATPAPTATPTPATTPTPAAPRVREVPLEPGTRAVVHAQGECLRVRDGASLSATTIACIASGASVSVLDGAVERDGYRWQRIGVGAAEGWAADVYLEPAGAAPTPATPAIPAGSRILSPSELRAALELSAWPRDLWLTVERIIRCESGGNLDAVGPLGHRGLMQVAPWFHGAVPTDAVGQLNQGHQVYLKQGWQAWECY